jgi:hypothetical protein
VVRYTDKNGNVSGWLSDKPTKKELERLTIDMLLVIAKRKRGLKKALVEFLIK